MTYTLPEKLQKELSKYNINAKKLHVINVTEVENDIVTYEVVRLPLDKPATSVINIYYNPSVGFSVSEENRVLLYVEYDMIVDNRLCGDRHIYYSKKYRETYNEPCSEKIISLDTIERIYPNKTKTVERLSDYTDFCMK